MGATSSTPADERAQEGSTERSPRCTFRFREYALGPDKRPEAQPVTFEMYCASCYVTGPVSTDAEDGSIWALEHLKKNPSHLDYREHVTRSYRAEPGAWQ